MPYRKPCGKTSCGNTIERNSNRKYCEECRGRTKKTCNVSGCNNKTDVEVRICRACRDKREPDYSRSKRPEGPRWERVKQRVLNDQRTCERCGEREATEVDHIIPLRDGGKNVASNLQALCKPCHSEKTAREVNFGESTEPPEGGEPKADDAFYRHQQDDV